MQSNVKRLNQGKQSFGSHRQQGSMWGILFNCAILLFFGYIAMLLVPVYSSSSAVQAAMTQTAEQFSSASQVSKREVVKAMDKRLYIDGVTGIDLNDIVVDKTQKDVATLSLDYATKVPLFYNISLLLDFSAAAEKRN